MLLILMTAGLSLLLILRDIAGISMSKFYLFGYTVGCMAIVNYKTLVYMLCFIMPLLCGLPGTYIMPCALVLLILKKGTLDIRRFLMICAILVMELVASFWYPEWDIKLIVQYVSFAGVMIYLSHDKTVLDYKLCLQMFLLGVVLLNGVIVVSGIMTAPLEWLSSFAKGWFRFGNTHVNENSGMVLSLNANSMAYYSVVGMCCGVLLVEQYSGARRVWNLLLIVFCVISGFLTVSLTWVLVTAGCAVLYIAGKLRSPKQIALLVSILIILAMAGGVALTMNPDLAQGLITRLNGENVGDANGRVDSFLRYNQAFFGNVRYMLFGAGVTQYNSVMQLISSVHNGTQQILVCCGLIGFVVYMEILISAVTKARRHKKLPMVYWLPLISVVVFVQAIQFLNPMMLMMPYTIGIYGVRTGMKTLYGE